MANGITPSSPNTHNHFIRGRTLSIINVLNGSGCVPYVGFAGGSIDPRYIPVGLCGADWKNGDLFQDVRHYAPEAV